MFAKSLIFFALFAIPSALPINSSNHLNNACTNFDSYLNAPQDSVHCYYEPDIFSDSKSILKRHTKKFDTHEVTTEDGYILTVFRIPKRNPKGVVILQHGLITDSVIWIAQSNESLAFLMWNAGYEVWLPNNRGTTYSQKHTTLSNKDAKFWEFSFHEIGIYDYPAVIQYIRRKTRQAQLVFIGHSMGCTASTIYAALKPDEAKKSVKVFIQISPSAHLNHVTSPIKYLAPLIPSIDRITNILNIHSAFEYNSPIGTFFHFGTRTPFQYATVLFTNWIFGWTLNEFDPKLTRLAASLNPRGSSLRNFFHYGQIINSPDGKFRMYDHGETKNLQLYNSTEPLEYPVENIRVPQFYIYSTSDTVAPWQDSEELYRRLRPEAKIYGRRKISGLNHMEVLFGRRRQEQVNDPIFKLLNKIL